LNLKASVAGVVECCATLVAVLEIAPGSLVGRDVSIARLGKGGSTCLRDLLCHFFFPAMFQGIDVVGEQLACGLGLLARFGE